MPGSAHAHSFLESTFCAQNHAGRQNLAHTFAGPCFVRHLHISAPQSYVRLCPPQPLYRPYTCQNPICPRIYGTGKLPSPMSSNCAIWLHIHAGAGDRPGFWLPVPAAISGVSSRIINGTTMSHASWASCLSHLMPSENLESPGSGPALFPSEMMPLLSAQVHNRSRDKGSTKEENSVWELRSPGPQLLYFRTSASVPSAPCILREVGKRKGTRLVGNMGCFPDGGFPGKRLPPTQGSIRHTLHVWH